MKCHPHSFCITLMCNQRRIGPLQPAVQQLHPSSVKAVTFICVLSCRCHFEGFYKKRVNVSYLTLFFRLAEFSALPRVSLNSLLLNGFLEADWQQDTSQCFLVESFKM